MLKVNANFDDAIRQLDDLQKRQIPFAAKNALNRLAQKAIEAEQDEMKSAFNNPARWTLNSLFVRQYATKDNLQAVMDFKDGTTNRSASKYLTAQINGGSRRSKAVENYFVRQGLMPAGCRIVPAANLRLNRHGNITLSAFRAMVSGVRAGTHFALHQKQGRLSAGLYKRGSGRKVKALIFYVPSAIYEKRLRYFETAQQSVAQNQQSIFKQELDYALRTAR